MIPINPKTPGPCQPPWPNKIPSLLGTLVALAVATVLSKVLSSETGNTRRP